MTNLEMKDYSLQANGEMNAIFEQVAQSLGQQQGKSIGQYVATQKGRGDAHDACKASSTRSRSTYV
jgi:hypothetical protein